jgi:polyferredoxin
MSEESDSSVPTQKFDLTPKQKRLRTLTFAIMLFIAAMLVFAVSHPFFHPHRPPHMPETVRKALAVQGILILGYYTLCFILALSLLVIAWLYLRDVRIQLALAQRDMWRQIADNAKNPEDSPERN